MSIARAAILVGLSLGALQAEAEEIPFRPNYWGFRERAVRAAPMPGFQAHGMVQLDGAAGSRGSSNRDTAVPARSGLGPHPANDSIYLRRGRLLGNWQLDENHRIFAQIQYDTISNQTRLFDLFLESRLNQDLTLSVGFLKPRFGWEALRSQANLNTVERSDLSEALRPIRDLGANLGFRNQHFQADLGLFSGQQENLGERNSTKDLVGRIAWLPDEHWVFGTSWQLGSFTPDSGREIPVSRLGLEFRSYWQPFALEAEYFWSSGYNKASRADTRAQGFTVTGLCELSDQVDLVLSHDHFDPDLDRFSVSRLDNAANARSRTVVGVNYYLDRAEYHRVMLNYEWHSTLEGASGDRGNWRVRYQVRF